MVKFCLDFCGDKKDDLKCLKIATKEQLEEINNAAEYHEREKELEIDIPIKNTNMLSSEDEDSLGDVFDKQQAKFGMVCIVSNKILQNPMKHIYIWMEKLIKKRLMI